MANELFRKIAHTTSEWTGTPWCFILAVLTITTWLMTGPIFNYSDTWQLVINTGTTIITFLMVFLIQNTQNRESKATQLKLDELIRSNQKARNEMIDLEELSDRELDRLAEEFKLMREKDQELHRAVNTVEKVLKHHLNKH